jgi:hypothetical protein
MQINCTRAQQQQRNVKSAHDHLPTVTRFRTMKKFDE